MTNAERLQVQIPLGIDPKLRPLLRHLVRAVDRLNIRTGGPTDTLSLISLTEAIDLDLLTVTNAINLDLLTVTGAIDLDLLTMTQAINLDYLTVTQAVDLDTMESDVSALQSRDLVAGAGLTGGGDLSADRTFNVIAGTGIAVSADAVSTNDSAIVHDNLSGFVANEHVNHGSVTLTAGAGLTGGGDITANRSFAIDTSIVIDKTAITDYVPTNSSTDRTWDTDAAAGGISSPPLQAEVEKIRDAVLELSDVVATLVADLGIT